MTLGAKKAAVLGDPLLGQVPDRVIAESHGTSVLYVFKLRHSVGIPAHRQRRSALWSEPLGTLPDAEFATKHNVTRERVRQIRVSRGIPAWRPNREDGNGQVQQKEQED